MQVLPLVFILVGFLSTLFAITLAHPNHYHEFQKEEWNPTSIEAEQALSTLFTLTRSQFSTCLDTQNQMNFKEKESLFHISWHIYVRFSREILDAWIQAVELTAKTSEQRLLEMQHLQEKFASYERQLSRLYKLVEMQLDQWQPRKNDERVIYPLVTNQQEPNNLISISRRSNPRVPAPLMVNAPVERVRIPPEEADQSTRPPVYLELSLNFKPMNDVLLLPTDSSSNSPISDASDSTDTSVPVLEDDNNDHRFEKLAQDLKAANELYKCQFDSLAKASNLVVEQNTIDAPRGVFGLNSRKRCFIESLIAYNRYSQTFYTQWKQQHIQVKAALAQLPPTASSTHIDVCSKLLKQGQVLDIKTRDTGFKLQKGWMKLGKKLQDWSDSFYSELRIREPSSLDSENNDRAHKMQKMTQEYILGHEKLVNQIQSTLQQNMNDMELPDDRLSNENWLYLYMIMVDTMQNYLTALLDLDQHRLTFQLQILHSVIQDVKSHSNKVEYLKLLEPALLELEKSFLAEKRVKARGMVSSFQSTLQQLQKKYILNANRYL